MVLLAKITKIAMLSKHLDETVDLDIRKYCQYLHTCGGRFKSFWTKIETEYQYHLFFSSNRQVALMINILNRAQYLSVEVLVRLKTLMQHITSNVSQFDLKEKIIDTPHKIYVSIDVLYKKIPLKGNTVGVNYLGTDILLPSEHMFCEVCGNFCRIMAHNNLQDLELKACCHCEAGPRPTNCYHCVYMTSIENYNTPFPRLLIL